MAEYFDAYYGPLATDERGEPILRGAAKMHAVQVHPSGVWLIRQRADYEPMDISGSVMADYPLAEADPDRMANVLAYSMGADPEGLFHPATVARCQYLESEGMSREQIVESIGALMIPEYLGSTIAEVEMVRPELFETRTETVDGVEFEVCDFSSVVIA